MLSKIYNLKHKMWVVVNMLRMRLAGVHYGRRLRMKDLVYLEIYRGSQVTIGDNFTLISGGGINALGRNIRSAIKVMPGASLTIGDDVGISCSSIRVGHSVTIGNHVMIGADCLVIDTDAHALDATLRRSGATAACTARCAPIALGYDVVVGARTIIMKGVTIGARTIIGAGSVVTHDLPDDCIAAGCPARIVRYLTE